MREEGAKWDTSTYLMSWLWLLISPNAISTTNTREVSRSSSLDSKPG